MRSQPVQEHSLTLIQRGLRRCNLFKDWPDLVIDRLARIARLEHYPRGAQVLAQDRLQRDVILAVSGTLAISGVNVRGGKFTLSLVGPGEPFGLIRLLNQGDQFYDYHAHVDSVVIHLASDALTAVIDQTPRLWKDVALLALSRHRDSIITMQRRALGGMQQSLAQALLDLARSGGLRPGGDGAIRLDLSQAELAHMLSVSRQTMNKELGLLAKQGLVGIAYGQVRLLDMPGLRRIAQLR